MRLLAAVPAGSGSGSGLGGGQKGLLRLLISCSFVRVERSDRQPGTLDGGGVRARGKEKEFHFTFTSD